MKVLIVEDDAQLRRVLIRLMRHMFDDIDPWAAESADQAIEYLREAALDRPFDLVISDFNLLGTRTGGDIIEWIRDHASYLENRFLFLSSDERAKKFHRNWLPKPAEAADLRAAIQVTLTGQGGH